MLVGSTERVHLSVAEARALSERAGHARDRVRARGGPYSGLPKLLNVAP